jgi:CsoR family transcriptional regulator, copper-sensing transcriptional repressor
MMAEKQDLLNRLKTIEGHVRGIQRMVEDDTYCVDILKQTKAIQRALDKFNSIVLERHDPSERERVIHELLQVFETSTRL